MQGIPIMLKTENSIIFTPKLFYLKHLVLTDTHYPTGYLLGHTIYFAQEAIALHCITSHQQLRDLYKKITKILMLACKISEPHPPCNRHTDWDDISTKFIKKQFSKNISAQASLQNSYYCSSKQILCVKEENL